MLPVGRTAAAPASGRESGVAPRSGCVVRGPTTALSITRQLLRWLLSASAAAASAPAAPSIPQPSEGQKLENPLEHRLSFPRR